MQHEQHTSPESSRLIRRIDKLANQSFDLVIVGGGIFGACCAWDAALRGLSVALLERGDFGQAASSNHFRLAHCGIRYLQHADFPRVRESAQECATLLRIAPHLVKPLPTVVPTYRGWRQGKTLLKLGFVLYGLITAGGNRLISRTGLRDFSPRLLSRRQVTEFFPDLQQKGLTGGGLFFEGHISNPARLVISFLRSAATLGAEAANYVEVEGFLRNESRVVGVQVRDRLSRRRFDIQAGFVVNCAGPWAGALLEKSLGIQVLPAPSFSRDAFLVLSKKLPSPFALALTSSTADADSILDRGARHLLFVPCGAQTLVGVWHKLHSGNPDDCPVSEREIELFLEEAQRLYPGLRLRRRDVCQVRSGLILFQGNQNTATRHRFAKRSILRDHSKTDGIEGLITLIGVRATVARRDAQRTVDLACRKMKKRLPPCATAVTPLFGGRFDSLDDVRKQARLDCRQVCNEEAVDWLVQNYGAEYPRVLQYLTSGARQQKALRNTPLLQAEVIHAVREEMAQSLSDVILRRTGLGTGNPPDLERVRECAQLLAAEAGWNQTTVEEEVQELWQGFRAASLTGCSGPERVVSADALVRDGFSPAQEATWKKS